ncbi:MAG: hypothetical protein PHV34_02815 [Verrucomicrobiae bacterium]|nr:hypothetical protein [Verrucomicrobiae bacterium]
MNLAFHLFKKDCRRLRWFVAIWFALLLAQLGLACAGMNNDYDWVSVAFNMFSQGVSLFRPLLWLVMIPMLIHEDNLVGTTAFWLTRPIGGRVLLAGKSLFVILILILPSLIVQLLEILGGGFSPVCVWYAIPEILLREISFATLAMVIAALTKELASFIMTEIAVAISIGIFSGILFIGKILVLFGWREGPASFIEHYLQDWIVYSQERMIVCDVFCVLFGIFLLFYQYKTRHATRSWQSLILAIFFVSGVISLVPGDSWGFFRPPPINRVFRGAAPTVTLSNDRYGKITSHASFTSHGQKMIDVPNPNVGVGRGLNITGLPQDCGGRLWRTSHNRITFRDGVAISLGQLVNTQFCLQNDGPAIQSAIGKQNRIINPSSIPSETAPLFVIGKKLYEKYSTTPARLDLTMDLVVEKYNATTIGPLEQNIFWRGKFSQLKLKKINKNKTEINIDLLEKKIALLFCPAVRLNPLRDMIQDRPCLFALRNPKQQELLIEQRSPDRHLRLSLTDFHSSSLRFERQTTSANGEKNVITDDWLADAELVRIEAVDVGQFRASLQVDDFVMDPGKK